MGLYWTLSLLILAFRQKDLAAGQCSLIEYLCRDTTSCDDLLRVFNCVDVDECVLRPDICGSHGVCRTSNGSSYCECQSGFRYNETSKRCADLNECEMDRLICGKGGACGNVEGTYRCHCRPGSTNYGKNRTACVKLDCDPYRRQVKPGQTLSGLDGFLSLIKRNCLALSNSVEAGEQLSGEVLLNGLVEATTDVLRFNGSSGRGVDSGEVTGLLSSVENALRLIAPQLTEPTTRINNTLTEVEIVVRRDSARPRGPISLTNENAQLDTTWETAIGDDAYPGFAFVTLLSYKNLPPLTGNGSAQQLNSRVVTVSVSNPNTTNLRQPINLTFTHLQPSDAGLHACVYWSDEEGAWSGRGCSSAVSNSTHTVCSCSHLSSLALLQHIHEKQTGGRLLIMGVAGAVAIACVVLSLFVTLWCRSKSRKQRQNNI